LFPQPILFQQINQISKILMTSAKISWTYFNIHKSSPSMIGVPSLKYKDSFLGLPNSPFSSLFPWHVLHFTLFFHVQWNNFVPNLCRHLKYLLFSLRKVQITKYIQCGPCSINGPKSQEIWLFQTFYSATRHFVFVTFKPFIHINT